MDYNREAACWNCGRRRDVYSKIEYQYGRSTALNDPSSLGSQSNFTPRFLQNLSTNETDNNHGYEYDIETVTNTGHGLRNFGDEVSHTF